MNSPQHHGVLPDTYARAIYAAAHARGGGPAVEEVLGQLQDAAQVLVSEARVRTFFLSPLIPAKDRGGLLERAFGGRVGELALNTLRVLNRRDRLGVLPAVVASLGAMYQRAHGRVEVDVWTAEPLSREAVDGLWSQLRGALGGREPIIRAYTDGSIIGGVRVQIGDRLYDASIATRLRRLRERLASDGMPEVRSAAARIFGDAAGALNGRAV